MTTTSADVTPGTIPDEGPTRPVTITVPAWLAAVRDPGVRAAIVLVLVAAGGFALFWVAWRNVARTLFVPLQIPWVVSAGMTGIALVGAAFAALSIHAGRRDDAALRGMTDDLVREAAELAEDLRTGRRRLPGRPKPASHRPRRGRRR